MKKKYLITKLINLQLEQMHFEINKIDSIFLEYLNQNNIDITKIKDLKKLHYMKDTINLDSIEIYFKALKNKYYKTHIIKINVKNILE